MSGLTWMAFIRQLITERKAHKIQKCGAEYGMIASYRQRTKQEGMINQKRPAMS